MSQPKRSSSERFVRRLSFMLFRASHYCSSWALKLTLWVLDQQRRNGDKNVVQVGSEKDREV